MGAAMQVRLLVAMGTMSNCCDCVCVLVAQQHKNQEQPHVLSPK